MRPASETHLALLQAAHALRVERAESGQGATLLELVHRSQVGYKVARALVPKLKERGQLVKAGERQVDYRNRPVDEYLPAETIQTTEIESRAGHGWVDLNRCLSGWHANGSYMTPIKTPVASPVGTTAPCNWGDVA